MHGLKRCDRGNLRYVEHLIIFYMKLFFFLCAALLACGAASAQRIQFGLRGGINTVDQQFGRVRIGDAAISSGKVQIGYDVGLVLRWNLTKRLHLQTELNYAFTDYDYRVTEVYTREVKIRTERLEIPVELGLQFGAFRLFGGAQFRVMQSGRSTSSQLFKVRFNDDDIALVGGCGLNIKKFFIDIRITGFPRSHVWNTFVCDGITRRVQIERHLVYGGSIGFFF